MFIQEFIFPDFNSYTSTYFISSSHVVCKTMALLCFEAIRRVSEDGINTSNFPSVAVIMLNMYKRFVILFIMLNDL